MRMPKKEKLIGIVLLFALVSAVAVVMSSLSNGLAEKDIAIAELKTEASKKSDIEVILELSTNFKEESEKYLKVIKLAEESYEKSLLTHICYKTQWERLMTDQEVDIKYCENETNLEQYRTKK